MKISNLQNIAIISGSNQIVRILALLTKVYLGKVFTPAQFGVISLGELFLFYADKAYSPIRGGMDREVPRLKGREEYAEAGSLQALSLYAIALLSVLISAGLLLAIAVYQPQQHYALALYAVINIPLAIVNYFRIYLKTERRFDKIGLFYLAHSAATFILTIAFLRTAAVTTYLYILLVTNLIFSIFLLMQFRTSPAQRPNRQSLKLLASAGLAMASYDLAFALFEGVDRLVIASVLGSTALGLYAFPVLIAQNILIIPNSINSVIFPEYFEAVAKKDQGAPQLLESSTVLAQAITPMVIAAAWFGYPVLLDFWLSNFAQSEEFGKILFLSAFWSASFTFGSIALLAHKRTRTLISAILVATAIAVMLFFLTASSQAQGLPQVLERVAWASTAAAATLSILLSVLADRCHRRAAWFSASKLLKQAGLFAWLAILLLQIDTLAIRALDHVLLQAIVGMVVFCLGYYPLLAVAEIKPLTAWVKKRMPPAPI